MAQQAADVIVVGAGVAGLAARDVLARAGLRVIVLEARDRVGGRIWTARDGVVPVELGAEFIHGRPPEIFALLDSAGVETEEVRGQPWCVEQDRLVPCGFFAEVDRLLRRMEPPVAQDESFADFLRRCCGTKDQEAGRWAREFVQGFHAAPAERISVQSLVRGEHADREIEGDRSFRMPGGYDSLLGALRAGTPAQDPLLRLNAIVREIRWSNGAVAIQTEEAGEISSWRAPAAVITLPLPLLQNDEVRFEPPLRQKRDALSKLAMGAALRVTLQFRECFWESNSGLEEMSFLFSPDPDFPTWWTLLPRRAPVLTGWCAGPRGQRMSHRTAPEVIGAALSALARILHLPEARMNGLLERSWVHDWQADPFARGAYSHVLVGGDGAQQSLAAPLANTLFFAGEATDWNGHHSTVHGALASGRRAAAEVLNSR